VDEAEMRPISELRHLQLLDITACDRITDAAVAQVASVQ